MRSFQNNWNFSFGRANIFRRLSDDFPTAVNCLIFSGGLLGALSKSRHGKNKYHHPPNILKTRLKA
ncbi:hypothetical protein L485_12735 [Sphingobium baderi LL03]|uniref:Uncharacterized protein n=1 Tax=Sphingobium baderi LL03 TaxID=1114964 RepID=T0GLC8_9SPHN|nr:hypothetical protein L485_12735 [Sphingobium baderi LL03]